VIVYARISTKAHNATCLTCDPCNVLWSNICVVLLKIRSTLTLSTSIRVWTRGEELGRWEG